jgi:hypothetical protein
MFFQDLSFVPFTTAAKDEGKVMNLCGGSKPLSREQERQLGKLTAAMSKHSTSHFFSSLQRLHSIVFITDGMGRKKLTHR